MSYDILISLLRYCGDAVFQPQTGNKKIKILSFDSLMAPV